MRSTDLAQQVGATLGATPLRPRLPHQDKLEGAIKVARLLLSNADFQRLAEQRRANEIDLEEYDERLRVLVAELDRQGEL